MKAIAGSEKRAQPPKLRFVEMLYRDLIAFEGESVKTGRAAILVALALLYFCLVGWLDLVVPRDLDLHLFYLLGCALVGWLAGPRAAFAGALVSGAFLWGTEIRAGREAVADWIFFWNLVVRVLGLASIGWLAGLAGKRARHLEKVVKRRTATLRAEVEMHRETASRWHDMAQLFRQVTENITEVFWVSDPARARLNYVSPGFERIWMQPVKAAYLDPNAWIDGVHPEDRERLANAIKKSGEAGCYDEEYRVVRPDGTIRWVHDRAFPVRDENRKLYRLAGIAEDITEQRKQEMLRTRLEKQILEISDREQARIGQDIHDGLCQQLVGAAFAANSLEQTLAAQAHPELAKAVRVTNLLDQAITESRRVARGLYPVRLSTTGLACALEELATNTTAVFGVRCAFHPADQEVSCTPATATHLYRIAQEAVNNAAKHSRGSNIEIRLRANKDVIELEVRDDGRGVPEMCEKAAGMGLHIMKYRARSLGGEVQLRSSRGGTTLKCRVPQAETRTCQA